MTASSIFLILSATIKNIDLFLPSFPPSLLSSFQKYLGQRAPGSFLSYHENTLEFRQTHIFPERSKEGEVVVFSPIQVSMEGGREGSEETRKERKGRF